MKKVISKDGTAIAYDQTGSGPVLILVDGAFCSRTFGPMPKLAPLLAPHFTVIAYDRRGRGDSTDTKPYAVAREIEDLEALINEAGGSAFVMGMSSGAVLALRAAAAGLNITKLALYEPPFVTDRKNGHHPPADHTAHLTQLIASGQRSEAAKYYLVSVIGMPSIFYYVMRLFPMWSKMKAIAPSLPYDSAVMGDFGFPAELISSVMIPTLASAGEKSPALLRNAVEAVAKTLPNAQRRMLAGQTHNVSVKVLAPVLSDFLGVSFEGGIVRLVVVGLGENRSQEPESRSQEE
ncbi:MAG TPA: alpha/beta hydrolase [Chryseolinea sp.]